MIYDRFDVVKVPFPFTDKQSTKVRPALVVSNAEFNQSVGKSVFAMITSTTRNNWLHDTVVTDLSMAGLTVPSRVRMKLFTIDNDFIIKLLGRLSDMDSMGFERNFDNLSRRSIKT